jgi:hypothetical protein
MDSNRPVPDFDENDLLSALSELLSATTEGEEKGLTFREIQVKTGFSKVMLRRLLQTLKDGGRLSTERVRRKSIDDAYRTVPVYWVVPVEDEAEE